MIKNRRKTRSNLWLVNKTKNVKKFAFFPVVIREEAVWLKFYWVKLRFNGSKWIIVEKFHKEEIK